MSLPAPTGRYPVGLTDWYLTDTDRSDPWTSGQRELMVQIWYPADDRPSAPGATWMPPGGREEQAEFLTELGVPSGSWDLAPSHSESDVPARSAGGRFPVLLHSPGMDDTTGWSTAQAEDLASHGYVVVAINHTHEAFAVQFPDGRTERSRVPLDSPPHVLSDLLLPTRVADARFVLDRLVAASEHPDHAGLPRHLAEDLDVSRVGMFGHSLGGSTTAQTMHDDHRIRAGADLDGPILGSVAADGLDRPLLMLASDNSPWFGHPGWEPQWATDTGLKLPLRVAGTRHMSLCDQQAILPQLAAAGLLDPAKKIEAVGTIDPSRSIDLQRAYLAAYFDANFGRTDGDIPQLLARLAQPEMLAHP
ncbi:alpha/beta hydrolase family protein [Nocardia nova]|uniref:alpha/beta hydrolase family protein n=1 Tax=Nocardia nova TaxID=37330 RepID=UPI0011DE453A|nr:hydrolase [Nocardia nova]